MLPLLREGAWPARSCRVFVGPGRQDPSPRRGSRPPPLQLAAVSTSAIMLGPSVVSLLAGAPASKEPELDIRIVQRQAWDNKLAKGFNVSDVALEFGLLTAEVSEAFTAWRNRLPDFGEELADILIYLAGLA